MRENAGKKLYVRPISWSDIHTKLLGVRFAELDRIVTPWHHGDVPQPSETAIKLSRDLSEFLRADELSQQIEAIKSVMTTLFPKIQSRAADLDLFFGVEVSKKAVRIPVLWHHPDFAGQATSKQPLLAYINRKELEVRRAELVKGCQCQCQAAAENVAVANLQRLQLKLLVPAQDDHDAYYVSVLLAIAQAYFYSGSGAPSQTFPPKFSDVTVRLMAHSRDPAELVVYTAVVTREFLERFAHPTKAPANSRTYAAEKSGEDSSNGLHISYVHVPIWPVFGLRERLAKAVGPDIAGRVAFDDAASGTVEMWHTPEKVPEMNWLEDDRLYRVQRPSQATKRASSDMGDRNLLVSEVMNSSFEDNDDTAGCASEGIPVLSPDAKRRCTRTVHPREVC